MPIEASERQVRGDGADEPPEVPWSSIRDGDPEAIRWLWERIQEACPAVLLRHGARRDELNALLSDVLDSILRYLESRPSPVVESINGFLRFRARHVLREWRRRQLVGPELAEEPVTAVAAQDRLLRDELLLALEACLLEIRDARHRSVMRLRCEDYRPQDIAARLGMRDVTVRSIVFRLGPALHQCLQGKQVLE